MNISSTASLLPCAPAPEGKRPYERCAYPSPAESKQYEPIAAVNEEESNPSVAALTRLRNHWGEHINTHCVPLHVSEWLADFLKQDIEMAWSHFLKHGLPTREAVRAEFEKFCTDYLKNYTYVSLISNSKFVGMPSCLSEIRLWNYIEQRGNEGWSRMIYHALENHHNNLFGGAR